MDEPENFFPICYLAATHRLPTNAVYSARIDELKARAVRDELRQSIVFGRLNSDALYVFQDTPLFPLAAQRTTSSDWVGIVDGYRVIAPDWGDSRFQMPNASREVNGQFQTTLYRTGSTLQCKNDGRSFMIDGWSDSADESGVWSVGRDASILLPLDEEPPSDMLLTFEGDGLINPRSSQQRVIVLVNGTRLGEFSYTKQDPNGWRSIRIRRDLMPNRFVLIQFQFPDAVSPANLGLSADSRNLALRIKALALKPAEMQN